MSGENDQRSALQRVEDEDGEDDGEIGGLEILSEMAPDNFYRWPFWKRLLLAIPLAILAPFVAATPRPIGGLRKRSRDLTGR